MVRGTTGLYTRFLYHPLYSGLCLASKLLILRRLAPRHGFEPRFTAPKAAVLPLDDRGESSCGRRTHSSVASADEPSQRSVRIGMEASLGRCRARASNPSCGTRVSQVGSTPTSFRQK